MGGMRRSGAIRNPQKIVIPKRGLIARGICCLLPAASRFLADASGFGMTRFRGYLRKPYRYQNGATLTDFVIVTRRQLSSLLNCNDFHTGATMHRLALLQLLVYLSLT
jgi:hypothetical protein